MKPTQMLINGGMDKKDVVYTHNGILFSHEKEGNLIICNKMDEPWAHYAKQDKSDRNTSTVWCHLYVEPKKVKPVNKQTV